MHLAKKLYIYIAAILIGIVIALCMGHGLLSASDLAQANKNGDHNDFFITIPIAIFSLAALGLICLSIKTISGKTIEEAHSRLKQFRGEGGFTCHSNDEVTEFATFFEDALNELHSLLQSVQIKTQAIDCSMETLTNGIHQVVADQTNLISLNAAIVAARSQQDGFSVISSEIVSLIEHTRHLTHDVRDTAKQLRTGVNEVVAELEHVLRQVNLRQISASMSNGASGSVIQEEKGKPAY